MTKLFLAGAEILSWPVANPLNTDFSSPFKEFSNKDNFLVKSKHCYKS